jgi:hypothetical protein
MEPGILRTFAEAGAVGALISGSIVLAFRAICREMTEAFQMEGLIDPPSRSDRPQNEVGNSGAHPLP